MERASQRLSSRRDERASVVSSDPYRARPLVAHRPIAHQRHLVPRFARCESGSTRVDPGRRASRVANLKTRELCTGTRVLPSRVPAISRLFGFSPFLDVASCRSIRSRQSNASNVTRRDSLDDARRLSLAINLSNRANDRPYYLAHCFPFRRAAILLRESLPRTRGCRRCARVRQLARRLARARASACIRRSRSVNLSKDAGEKPRNAPPIYRDTRYSSRESLLSSPFTFTSDLLRCVSSPERLVPRSLFHLTSKREISTPRSMRTNADECSIVVATSLRRRCDVVEEAIDRTKRKRSSNRSITRLDHSSFDRTKMANCSPNWSVTDHREMVRWTDGMLDRD